MRLLLALLCCWPLGAQTIDAARSGFVGAPNGRPGTCAPYRLVFQAAEGETAQLEVAWGRTRLQRRVNVTGGATTAMLPVPVAEGVTITVRAGGEAVYAVTPPTRDLAAGHASHYVAVFSGDALYARAVLGAADDALVADSFELSAFFDDWRLLDGYDAVVLFNPDGARLPAGAQRAIAEYCSLGGVVLVAGTFAFGEAAQGLPAPDEPLARRLADTDAQRFGYGAGAIYRCEWPALRRAASAREVVRAALLDQYWRGQANPPAGPPPTRAAPAMLPMLEPGPPERGRPGVLFWVCAAALVAGCAAAPALARRLWQHALSAPAGVAACAAVAGFVALAQSAPRPMADTWGVTNGGAVTATRGFVVAPADTIWGVDLDDPGQRALPRPAGRGWVVDQPLTAPAPAGGFGMRAALVDGENFRDFATRARLGAHGFGAHQGRILDWWLHHNAYAGRVARLLPGCADVPVPPGTTPRGHGGITVGDP